MLSTKFTPYLLILTVVMSGCSSVPVPSVTSAPPSGENGGLLESSPAVTLSFIDGMQFASGYDSATGGFLGTTSCLVPLPQSNYHDALAPSAGIQPDQDREQV